MRVGRQEDSGKAAPDKDSLESLEHEATQPVIVPKRETSPQKQTRKKKGVSEEEARMRLALANANARSLIGGVEQAKKIAAENLVGVDWSGCDILPEEEAELIEILTRFLDSVGWDLANPKAMIAMLVLSEIRITMRQYRIASMRMKAKEEVK